MIRFFCFSRQVVQRTHTWSRACLMMFLESLLSTWSCDWSIFWGRSIPNRFQGIKLGQNQWTVRFGFLTGTNWSQFSKLQDNFSSYLMDLICGQGHNNFGNLICGGGHNDCSLHLRPSSRGLCSSQLEPPSPLVQSGLQVDPLGSVELKNCWLNFCVS